MPLLETNCPRLSLKIGSIASSCEKNFLSTDQSAGVLQRQTNRYFGEVNSELLTITNEIKVDQKEIEYPITEIGDYFYQYVPCRNLLCFNFRDFRAGLILYLTFISNLSSLRVDHF